MAQAAFIYACMALAMAGFLLRYERPQHAGDWAAAAGIVAFWPLFLIYVFAMKEDDRG